MEELKEWLELQMFRCDDLSGLEREKWAFIQCLKKVKELELNPKT